MHDSEPELILISNRVLEILKKQPLSYPLIIKILSKVFEKNNVRKSIQGLINKDLILKNDKNVLSLTSESIQLFRSISYIEYCKRERINEVETFYADIEKQNKKELEVKELNAVIEKYKIEIGYYNNMSKATLINIFLFIINIIITILNYIYG